MKDIERTFLAMECAEALGLKPFSPILYHAAVKKSEIPAAVDGDVVVNLSENSLLTMGLVYNYGGTLTVIDASGDSYIMANNNVVKDELKKCGYHICGYGKSEPDFSENEVYASGERAEVRSKVTLSNELAAKVMRHEGLAASALSHSDKYAYDVFDSRIASVQEYNFNSTDLVAEQLGFESPITRKFMALTGYGCISLGNPNIYTETLKDFAEVIGTHPALNDERYYGPGEMYEHLSSKLNSKK